MSSVAHPPPEQGQLVSVRSRQWVVNDVRASTLPPPALKPTFHGPQHLLTLASVEDDGLGEEPQVIWEIEPGARVIEKVALPIASTAAYLLAAPSVPDEARQVAKEIVAKAKKKRRPRRQKPVPADKLGVRLVQMLRRYQERWPGELSALTRHLREFADALDMRGKKKARG